jgi:glycerate 2-kinase
VKGERVSRMVEESTNPRIDAWTVLRAALTAVDGRGAVRRALRLEGGRLLAGDAAPVDLEAVRSVWLLGAGKAVCRMAQGALDALGGRISGGSLTTKAGHALPLPGLEVWEAGHPLPDVHGLAGAAEALRLAREAGEGDLVLCLLSGGASALWPAPPEGVSLEELRAVTEALLRAGAPIGEVNAVRKHLSRIAGGGLARAAAPARVLTLAISDVIGSPPDAIGSGPTVPDPTTFAEALRVLGDRGIRAPSPVVRHLQAGTAGVVPETLKPGDEEAAFVVVARLRDALEEAARAAERLGYRPRILTDRLEGEARGAGEEIARMALLARNQAAVPVALLWGGEPTVTVRGEGRGGRAQELALAAARVLDGEGSIVLAALGTDGTDGPTDAAGAMVDGGTLSRARQQGLDPADALMRNDSNPLLRAAGDLLVTGPTGTNVGDVILALVG